MVGRKSRDSSRWSLLGACILLAGCTPERILAAPEQMFLWFFIPLMILFLGGWITNNLYRRRQLAQWDLHSSPSEPPIRRLMAWNFAVMIVLILAFVIYNLRVDVDPKQQIWNVALWTLGSLIGGTLGLMSGLRSAEP